MQRFMVLVHELVGFTVFIFITVSVLPAEVAELLVLSGDSLLAFSLLYGKYFLLLDVLGEGLEVLLAEVLIIASGSDKRLEMRLSDLSVLLLGSLVGEAAAAFSKTSGSMVLLATSG